MVLGPMFLSPPPLSFERGEWLSVTLRPLSPADTVPAPFTVLVAAAGISVAFFFAGWAATSANNLTAVPVHRAGLFTAAVVAAGGAAVLGGAESGDWRCCCLAALHSLVLFSFL